jgi:hypothetical protein
LLQHSDSQTTVFFNLNPADNDPSFRYVFYRFPDALQWITEYNLNDQDLTTTQSFFNTSLEYFDRLENVERYSYFGSFRSSVSNVGPNAVMLNNAGQLTDIGSWYLGGSSTGIDPQSGLAARSPVNWRLAGTLVCLGSIIVLI